MNSLSKMKSVADVVGRRHCLGCGACAWICPNSRVDLVDFLREGIRPVVSEESDCSGCSVCLDVCPGISVEFPEVEEIRTFGSSAEREWGPLLEIWEGHAVDAEIRYQGSSGGALTAIAAYCMEKGGMFGTLHIGQDPDDPIRNRTRLSRTREHLMAATGSRYSPASVCNGLGLVRDAPKPCVVIGKPTEVAALRKAEGMDKALGAKVGVALSFFCAETPSTLGTRDYLETMGVDAKDLSNLCYRGRGWPGHFAPTKAGEDEPVARVTYRESWASIQAYRPWSVQLWPDGGGELADISCGDPWYQEPDGKNPGSSLVIVRTERGREIVRGAMEHGYLELEPAELWKLEKSQENLIKKKGAVWGRLMAMRVTGLATPRFGGGHLFQSWRGLSLSEKLRSTLGTFRRIFSKGLRHPLQLDRTDAVAVKEPFVAGEAGGLNSEAQGGIMGTKQTALEVGPQPQDL